MQIAIFSYVYRLPLQALFELADIRCGNRPICSLIVSQPQFNLAEPLTNAGGREMTLLSFLGPFLDISVFAEDQPKVAEKLFSGEYYQYKTNTIFRTKL